MISKGQLNITAVGLFLLRLAAVVVGAIVSEGEPEG